ncbi:SusC/RagA family TonB-linked outer membrane protein [Dinghuibacter silviterrae]|uniref:TonB-linked SusC/RagA family outer membrane protein n=1 Tax=Dinghuibacter silviterrae TaxID=1539049 RepID=A0A4R8DGJ8_9BACT|nr:SusC/RagA family TonB-linked outer membrane protein [Dinghuibacter silviterrae]TDW96577.1 TonB-linked SusC/RagA family outer membrane protein [Dinghuibacter silviterrae]
MLASCYVRPPFTILLLALCLNVSARSFSQKVTLSFRDVPLSRVLDEISRQTNVSIIYREDVFHTRVSVHVRNSTVEEALEACLRGQPLTYRIENNSVLIQERPSPPGGPLEGKVVDERGSPLAGVTVEVKGAQQAAVTDDKGVFSFTSIDPDATLVVSYVGYQTEEIKLRGRSFLDIRLTPSTKALDQVVVIGYGTQHKRDVTSAISTIDTKDISSRPIVSGVEALTGKAPGVQVTVPSGTPGGDLSVRIRGVGSPNGSEPLYVVDGVLTNDIRGLDPGNIESISILKDASAAGIYGAAGSTNGVVMITTKKGAKGKAKIEASTYTGIQQIVKKIAVLNNQQWLDLETEIFGTAPTIPSYYNLTTTNNNWQNLIYHSAAQTGANVGMSGGSEKGTYYLGVGYLTQDGIMVGSNFDRYSAKLSVDQNAANWLSLGANLNYNRSNQRTVPQDESAQNGGAVIAALVTPEYIPIKMPSNAPYPGVYGYSSFYSGDNPLSDIYNNTNSTLENHLLGDAYVEVKLPWALKYRSQFNIVLDNSNYNYFLDPYNNLYGITLQGKGQNNSSETFRWAWDNTLTFDKTFGAHSINIVAGTSALDENIFLSSQSGTGFSSNAVQTLNAASAQYSISTQKFEWTTHSYFGRFMYAYKNRYLLTGTLRADGSSRVGSNNYWGTFPALSAGWKISQEKFMQNVLWIEDLKLRAGWGATGNLPPYTVLYPSYTLLSAGASYAYSGSNVEPGVSPGTQLGNPAMKWESAHQTNVGFDAGFLSHRLSVSADYYYKKVYNMIFTQQLPLTTGGLVTAVNLPGYDVNKGFEYSIDATVIHTHDISWDVTWNMSINHNEMEGLDTAISYQTGGVTVGGSKAPIYTGLIKNGYSLGTFYGYQALGVNAATGNMTYSANPTSLGSALPKYTFGLGSEWRYKAFTLSLLFDGVQGNKVYDETRMEIENLTGYNNESAAVLARWKNDGDVTAIPRALDNGTTNATAAALLQSQIASNYVENGSFVRLRNATLGYAFDPKVLRRLELSGLRIYVTAQNLFTITKYKGYYPEINGFGQGTNNQAVNAGVGATLMALGIDNGAYPVARTYIVGVNIQL